MDETVKLLEERIRRAVTRLRELSDERDALREELERLRTHLSGEPVDGPRVAAELREVARALRTDSD